MCKNVVCFFCTDEDPQTDPFFAALNVYFWLNRIPILFYPFYFSIGIDTPFYLATLPVGAKEPYGQFISERKVVDLDEPFYF